MSDEKEAILADRLREKTLSINDKKSIVGTEELNLTTTGETRKSLLIIKPSAATCACRGASHILTDGEAGDTIIINFSITKECKWQRGESNPL